MKVCEFYFFIMSRITDEVLNFSMTLWDDEPFGYFRKCLLGTKKNGYMLDNIIERSLISGIFICVAIWFLLFENASFDRINRYAAFCRKHCLNKGHLKIEIYLKLIHFVMYVNKKNLKRCVLRANCQLPKRT